jgi:2-isopropylmalate synthase
VAYVELRRGQGPSLHGVGIDANLVVASLKAVVSAVNRSVEVEGRAVGAGAARTALG